MAKKLFLAITLLLLMSTRLYPQTAKPDFAFPMKVEKAAKADLDKAVKTDNGSLAVNALVRLALAKNMVDTDSLAAASESVSTMFLASASRTRAFTASEPLSVLTALSRSALAAFSTFIGKAKSGLAVWG